MYLGIPNLKLIRPLAYSSYLLGLQLCKGTYQDSLVDRGEYMIGQVCVSRHTFLQLKSERIID